nr:peptidase M20 [Lautropia sp.]
MDLSEVSRILDRKWRDDLVPRLVDYVKVPAKSPAFDASWSVHGELAQVVASAHAWCAQQD